MITRPEEELPEEFRHSVPEQFTEEREHQEPQVLADEFPVETGTVGNGWLLLGIFLLIGIGVLMLLIFASGGNANASMML